MINCQQLKDLIIIPALNDLKMLTDSAVRLLLFTVAAESLGGYYLKQVKGTALGIYQMEPKTYNDIWQNYIKSQPTLMLKLLYNFDAPTMPSEERLIYDLRFATVMARIHYKRVAEPIPESVNTQDLFAYYKKYYNTEKGKAEYEQCLQQYSDFTCTNHILNSSNCS